MLAKFSKWLVVVTLSMTFGFHWTALQSVAWVGMLVDYSCQGSLQDAVTKTFDGKHPCPLCKLVRAGKNSENKPTAQQSLTKYDLFADRAPVFIFPPRVKMPAFSLFPMPLRVESPPLPPPRVLPG